MPPTSHAGKLNCLIFDFLIPKLSTSPKSLQKPPLPTTFPQLHPFTPMKHLILSILTLASLASAAEPIRIEKDIDFLGPDRREKADLYHPNSTTSTTPTPAIVIIHGGGWSGGDKGAAREINIGTTLAEHGYLCMSINYLLANEDHPGPTWPQNLHDCKNAVRWLRTHAARLNIDPQRIGTIGGSAGGHLATMLAITGPELDPPGTGDTSVRCAINLYGPVLWFQNRDISMFRQTRTQAPELYRQADPLTHVDKNDPPVLILHGTADKTVPVADSEALAAAMQKAGAPHQLVIIPGAPHTFHLQPKQQDLRPLVLNFLDQHLKK
jgi:acetyl esterase/lipase